MSNIIKHKNLIMLTCYVVLIMITQIIINIKPSYHFNFFNNRLNFVATILNTNKKSFFTMYTDEEAPGSGIS